MVRIPQRRPLAGRRGIALPPQQLPGTGTSGRMIDHSVNGGMEHRLGEAIYLDSGPALPRAPQRVRGALAALGAGALVRRSPSLAGNARVPIRDRRMTFWDRPAPALADRSVLG